MDRKIEENIKSAREFFEIKEFPINLLEHLERIDYVNKYNLLIFKENLGKLSGFIGYGDNDLTVICINYCRPIGHQNFTLAHEIGHWFLHKGQAISDLNDYLNDRNEIEKQANEFASELLYPEKFILTDYMDIESRDLFNSNKRLKLAKEIDKLCHKYCLSFEMVLRKMTYKAKLNYKDVKKDIDKKIGKISDYFEHDFYVVNYNSKNYKKYEYPYEILKQYVIELKNENKIGEATAESILYKNGIDLLK